MARMKTFLIYLLILVAFYIVSSILAYWYIQTTYSTIESHVIENPNIQVAIDDAQATLVNGYVSGTITNTSEEAINTKYIKFDLFSERGNKILSKYVQIDNLNTGEMQNFKMNFRAENIANCYAEVTDTVEQTENTQLINIDNLEDDPYTGIAVLSSALILMHFFL